MTGEQRREYKREWYQRNKERCKEYKRKSALKKAEEAFKSGRVVLVPKMEFQEVRQE